MREGEGPRERKQTETESPWAHTELGLVLTPLIKNGKTHKITHFSWKDYYNCSLFICYSGLALGGGEERAVCYMLFMDLTLQLGIGGSCHTYRDMADVSIGHTWTARPGSLTNHTVHVPLAKGLYEMLQYLTPQFDLLFQTF